MNNNKHTPGPWTQFVWNKEYPEIRTIGAPCGEGGAQDHLCAGEMSESDARLIAAAPELLRACLAAYADVMYDETESHALSYPVLEMLRTAIAKAEGEEK